MNKSSTLVPRAPSKTAMQRLAALVGRIGSKLRGSDDDDDDLPRPNATVATRLPRLPLAGLATV